LTRPPSKRCSHFALLAIVGAVAATVASSTATARQSIPEADLIVRRSTLREAAAMLAGNGVGDEVSAALFDDYRRQFKSALLAKSRSLEWMYAQGELANNTDIGSDLAHHDRSIELRWQVGARDASDALFDRMRSLSRSEQSTIDSLRRAHLRVGMVKHQSSSPEFGRVPDLSERLRTIDSAASVRPEVAEVLEQYNRELDPCLRRLDFAQYTFRRDFESLQKIILDARGADIPDPLKLEPIAQFYVRLDAEYPAIRAACRKSLAQLQTLLAEETFVALRTAADRTLFPFVFAEAGAVDPLIRGAAASADLTAEQRASLRDVQVNFDRATTKAIAKLASLYDRMLKPSHRELEYREWAYAVTRRKELTDLTATVREAIARTTDPFNEALQRWYGEAGAFTKAIDRIMGRAIEPDAQAASAPLNADDAEDATDATVPAPADVIMTEFATIVLPFVSRPALDERIAPLSPSTQAAIRWLHDDSVAVYETEHKQCDVDQERFRDAERRFAAANPGVNPWMAFGNDFGAFDAYARWAKTRQLLERQFDADVTALLEPAEVKRWLEQSRASRRARDLPQIRARWREGSTMDLAQLLGPLPLSDNERSALDESVVGYLTELNDALVAYEDSVEVITQAMHANAQAQVKPQTAREAELSAEANRDWARLGRTVPVLNERAIATFAALLTPDNRERLFAAFNREKYPTVFTPTPLEWAYDELQSSRSAGLMTEEQLRELGALRAAYALTQSDVQHRTVVALDQWQSPEQIARRGPLRDAYMREHEDVSPFDSDNPIAPLIRTRYDLVRRGADSVRQLIGESLFERMPLDVQIYLCAADYAIGVKVPRAREH